VSTLLRYFGDQVAVAGLLLLAGLAVSGWTARRRPGAAPWWVLSAAVTLALLTMTSWPAAGATVTRSVQWVPLHTVAVQLDNPNLALAVINLAGNVAVFVPLAFCLRMALRGRRRPAAVASLVGTAVSVLAGTAVSVLAEVLQLAVGSRATDVDDVLLNALGVVAGVGLAAALVAARSPSPAGRPAARMAGWSSRSSR
jgi:glycopeptide antibiotics resistance protein